MLRISDSVTPKRVESARSGDQGRLLPVGYSVACCGRCLRPYFATVDCTLDLRPGAAGQAPVLLRRLLCRLNRRGALPGVSLRMAGLRPCGRHSPHGSRIPPHAGHLGGAAWVKSGRDALESVPHSRHRAVSCGLRCFGILPPPNEKSPAASGTRGSWFPSIEGYRFARPDAAKLHPYQITQTVSSAKEWGRVAIDPHARPRPFALVVFCGFGCDVSSPQHEPKQPAD